MQAWGLDRSIDGRVWAWVPTHSTHTHGRRDLRMRRLLRHRRRRRRLVAGRRAGRRRRSPPSFSYPVVMVWVGLDERSSVSKCMCTLAGQSRSAIDPPESQTRLRMAALLLDLTDSSALTEKPSQTQGPLGSTPLSPPPQPFQHTQSITGRTRFGPSRAAVAVASSQQQRTETHTSAGANTTGFDIPATMPAAGATPPRRRCLGLAPVLALLSLASTQVWDLKGPIDWWCID